MHPPAARRLALPNTPSWPILYHGMEAGRRRSQQDRGRHAEESAMNTLVRRSGAHAAAARRGGVAAGCLIALGVLFILLAICVVYVAMNWRGWVASLTMQGTRALLAESTMAEDQKQAIMAEIDVLATDFKEGRVSMAELGRVFEELEKSPLWPLFGVQVAKEKYIDRSDMTSEERAAAERSLQRFAKGIHDKKITPAEEQITDAIKPIVRLKPGNQWEFKENPTRQEVDQFVANCKAKADEAQIPDEPFQIDFAAELKKVIADARKMPAPAAAPAAPGGKSGGG